MDQPTTRGAGWRGLELGGGRLEPGEPRRFLLPPEPDGYANAQIDDYGLDGRGAERFRWRPPVTLSLRARFSHPVDYLRGTAGFGFWNAPYGDPSLRRLALPRALWFFFASPPNDLPFSPEPPGRGWFAATVDAGRPRALTIAPLAPLVLLLNQSAAARRRIWPAVQRRLGVSFTHLPVDMTAWHDYRIDWRPDRCRFTVDGATVLDTPHSPRGPLGFVCWLDNQYLVLTPRGRVSAGLVPLLREQWMEVEGLRLERGAI